MGPTDFQTAVTVSSGTVVFWTGTPDWKQWIEAGDAKGVEPGE